MEGTQTLNVRMTFTEEVLGTGSNDPELHSQFIASKAPDAPTREEEIATVGVDEVIEKSTTVFSRNEKGDPILWDYQIIGFIIAAAAALIRSGNSSIANNTLKIKAAYKRHIRENVFVKPRQIPIVFNGDVGTCQRPLRGQTAKGERVALAHSETVPAGSCIDITITMLNPNLEGAVKEWLNYGEYVGIGQWRNSGKGRFTWVEIE